MNIQSFNTSPNFQAHKIANIVANEKGRIVSNMDIYRIERSDMLFLEKLKTKTNFKTLCPKLTEFLQKRWQRVFEYCIGCAHDSENRTYIAVQDDKPCGILTYTPNSTYFLEGICSIPQNKGKKVPFAGSALFYQIFKDAEQDSASGIELKAITNGPFDVIKKYEKLGFKQEKNADILSFIKMSCGKYKIKEQLKELPYRFDYTAIEDNSVSLDNLL